MRPIGKPTMSREEAGGMLRGVKRIKDTVIDKVSDVMSYPARRNAQKSMIESDKRFTELRAKNVAKDTAKAMQMKALEKVKKPELSQRDQYQRSMNRAQRAGGSNGVGVGR